MAVGRFVGGIELEGGGGAAAIAHSPGTGCCARSRSVNLLTPARLFSVWRLSVGNWSASVGVCKGLGW